LANRCAVLVHANEEYPSLDTTEPYGMSKRAIGSIIDTADLLWNYCYSIKAPLLPLFRRRVLIDLDPGILQIGGLSTDIGLHEHDVFLTVGMKMHDRDCLVPTLGVTWHRFPPIVYLPLWSVTPPPKCSAFSTLTAWNYGTMTYSGKELSIAKRDAYCEFVDLPARSKLSFELAADIHPEAEAKDLELLRSHGWTVVDPYEVAGSPVAFQHYIAKSQGEICCPKPIYRDLRTGWLSDRSAGYLASGRPVLMTETGISDHFRTGAGLITFQNMDDAVEAAKEISAQHARHSEAARAFAEEFLDAKRCLPTMLAHCE